MLRYLGGNFDDNIFAHFALATMLYDASFDVLPCRKYLNYFDGFIMNDDRTEQNDDYLTIFHASVDYIRNAVGSTTFNTFANYIKIEYVNQLMSIYQLADKTISRDQLYKITFAKGGIAFLALTYLMVPKMQENEKKSDLRTRCCLTTH